MAGNPKFLVAEKNGQELAFFEEHRPEAVDIVVDDTNLPYTAVELQTALESTISTGGSARYAVAFGRQGAVNVQNPTNPTYLRNYYGPTTDVQPFLIPETSEIVSVVAQTSNTATASFELLKNGVVVQTINITNGTSNIVSPLNIALVNGDALSGRLASGNTQNPVLTIHIKVLNE